jgi:BirA family transcriptional regulator, biotin operon repressor / biotin---[acetyl-CoA-carboxylase] ligase
MTERGALLRLLADGEPRTAETLATALGLSPADIGREFAVLAGWGLALEPAADHGYRLAAPLDLVDAARLEATLGAATRARLERLELHDELDSTNARLLADTGLAAGRFRVAIAEYQRAGRGRRGRDWLQPFGSGLCLSLGWLFPEPPAALGALSLAAGVATLRALARHGVAGLSLKWPNDVLKDGGKLGGILAELRLGAAGPAYVVVGVGLNVRLPAALPMAIAAAGGMAPADLAGNAVPSRTLLAATLIDELVAALVAFEAHGLTPFVAEWSGADALRDKSVRVHGADCVRDGVARGIAADGALRVEIGGRMETLTAGDVTLRAVA